MDIKDKENGEVTQDLQDDDNDVDVYGADTEGEGGSVDSFDLDGEDEADFDGLDDLEISDDEEAVDGKSTEEAPSEEALLTDLQAVVAQLTAMITGEEEGEEGLGDLEGGEDEPEFSLDGEGEGDPELPGPEEEDDEFAEAKEEDDTKDELEESNGSLENPAAMNKDGIVDTKVVSGGNESATIKSNSKKAKALPKGKKPTGDEGVEDPKDIVDTAIKAGKGTSKTNLPNAQSVLAVAQQMLSGNGKIINALYSGKTLAKEAFDAVEYKVDGRTLKSISALDENLSDDFKTGMVPVFERAVERKVRSILEAMVPLLNNMVTDEVATIEEGMVEKIDAYMDTLVENYFTENRTMIEEAQGVKISNGFLQGMRALFEAESVDVPVGKEDLVEKLQTQVESLTAKTTTLSENVRKYKSQAIGSRKEVILRELSEGLSVSEQEKLRGLASKQTGFKTLNEYRQAVGTLKTSLFETKTRPNRGGYETLVETVKKPAGNSKMDVYASALKKR